MMMLLGGVLIRIFVHYPCAALHLFVFSHAQECKVVEKEKEFYHFRHNTRSVKSTIVHFQVNPSDSIFVLMWKMLWHPFLRFVSVLEVLKCWWDYTLKFFLFPSGLLVVPECSQLRNLVWATSKHDVYLMHSYSVMHWSPLTRKGTEVLNVAGPVVPALEVIISVTSWIL